MGFFGYQWFHHEYEHGKHIKSNAFDVEGESGKYKVKVASLFRPLQLYSEEKKRINKIDVEKNYIIPHGGDLFSLHVKKAKLNFFIMDLAGHGFAAHKIADKFKHLAFKHRDEDDLLHKISGIWEKEGRNIMAEARKEIADAAEQAKFLHDKELVERHLREAQRFELNGFLTACQTIVDLDKSQIDFYNYGHPNQYLVIMSPKGEVLHFHAFPKLRTLKNTAFYLGLAQNFQFKKDHYSLDGFHKFRLILFSDAILEQTFSIPNMDKKEVQKLMKYLSKNLREEYHSFLDRENEKDRMFKRHENLLINTIKHLAREDPRRFVRMFDRLLIRINDAEQEDDITLVVADIEKTA